MYVFAVKRFGVIDMCTFFSLYYPPPPPPPPPQVSLSLSFLAAVSECFVVVLFVCLREIKMKCNRYMPLPPPPPFSVTLTCRLLLFVCLGECVCVCVCVCVFLLLFLLWKWESRWSVIDVCFSDIPPPPPTPTTTTPPQPIPPIVPSNPPIHQSPQLPFPRSGFAFCFWKRNFGCLWSKGAYCVCRASIIVIPCRRVLSSPCPEVTLCVERTVRIQLLAN